MASSIAQTAGVPSIFDLCEPRADVRTGAADADFAADLAKVIRGTASDEYRLPDRFFANTYPTRGLQNLLTNVCARLSGNPSAASIFRLDTSYGGGKTHGLIALVHAAAGMKGVAGAQPIQDCVRVDPIECCDPDFAGGHQLRIDELRDSILRPFAGSAFSPSPSYSEASRLSSCSTSYLCISGRRRRPSPVQETSSPRS